MKISLTRSISALIVEYHRLFAQTKKPEYREIISDLGKVKGPDFDELWEKKVNEGCDKQGIPHIYPKTGDNSPLPTTKEIR